jgi:hypothetical protein
VNQLTDVNLFVLIFLNEADVAHGARAGQDAMAGRLGAYTAWLLPLAALAL